jgi:hypothetical protein
MFLEFKKLKGQTRPLKHCNGHAFIFKTIFSGLAQTEASLVKND